MTVGKGSGRRALALEVCSRASCVALLAVVTGCGTSDVEPPSSGRDARIQAFRFSRSNVKTVLVGDTSTCEPIYKRDSSGAPIRVRQGLGYTYVREVPISLYFSVTDGRTISSLLKRIHPVPRQDEVGVDFAGVLSSQFFLDENNTLLAKAFIVCQDNTVVVSTNSGSIVVVDEEYRFVPTTNVVESVVFKRPEYVRLVYDLMMLHAPEEIQKRKDFSRQIGADLDVELFGEPSSGTTVSE